MNFSAALGLAWGTFGALIAWRLLRAFWELANRTPLCERCSKPILSNANFCRKCGMMLKSHYEIERWLRGQKDMLKLAESLSPRATARMSPVNIAGFDMAKRERPDGRSELEAALPATCAPPPRGK